MVWREWRIWVTYEAICPWYCFHSWSRNSWKSSAHRLTRYQKALIVVSLTSLYIHKNRNSVWSPSFLLLTFWLVLLPFLQPFLYVECHHVYLTKRNKNDLAVHSKFNSIVTCIMILPWMYMLIRILSLQSNVLVFCLNLTGVVYTHHINTFPEMCAISIILQNINVPQALNRNVLNIFYLSDMREIVSWTRMCATCMHAKLTKRISHTQRDILFQHPWPVHGNNISDTRTNVCNVFCKTTSHSYTLLNPILLWQFFQFTLSYFCVQKSSSKDIFGNHDKRYGCPWTTSIVLWLPRSTIR